ncbi:MAG TPA: FhaA domain-containing protein [Candidatus Eisenbacteria bacterium]|nr:FhaA domain-containing protein [Candidatus Eisenbacteria bacterium]
MRPLSGVERFFERLVERPAARLFGTQLRPVHVLRRIEREMEGGSVTTGGKHLAPDRFTVRVNPDDLPALEPLEGVTADLASRALAFARARSLILLERPRVAIHPDPAIRRGEVVVEAVLRGPVADAQAQRANPGDISYEQFPDRLDEGLGGATGTRVYSVPVANSPRALLRITEPDGRQRNLPLDGRTMRIGRAGECEIQLDDPQVSRQHARLQTRNGVLLLADMGSTNGTRVNGQRIHEVALGIGDRIEVGGSELLIAAEPRPGDPDPNDRHPG